jgi:uncharacterized protein (DUF362 family)
MKRRAFLIQTSKATAAAAAFAGTGVWLATRPVRGIKIAHTLNDYSVDPATLSRRFAAIHGTDPVAMIDAGIRALGGIEKFIKDGDRVLIKPNVGFDRPPVLGATTSPAVVAAVVDLCIQAGARRVVVSDNPINSPAASFMRSGIAEAAENSGAEVHYITERDFELIAVGGVAIGDFLGAVHVLDDIDRVIGIPTLKDHNLSGMSFAMKNWYGLLGRGRNRFHQDIHNVVADLAMMMKPTLIVGDATRILERHGPTGGSPADVRRGDTIIVSTDAVAIDAYGLGLLERPLSTCPSIELAAARGIGVINPALLRAVEVTV